MSQDLITRLRARPCENISPPAIELEAANRIEQLTSELDRAKRALVRSGFEDHGAAEWKPPIGRSPFRPINMNNHFQLTLTARGAVVYNSYFHQFPADVRPAELAAGDVLEDSLWHLMHIFGPHMFNGCQIPFEGNVVTPMND